MDRWFALPCVVFEGRLDPLWHVSRACLPCPHSSLLPVFCPTTFPVPSFLPSFFPFPFPCLLSASTTCLARPAYHKLLPNLPAWLCACVFPPFFLYLSMHPHTPLQVIVLLPLLCILWLGHWLVPLPFCAGLTITSGRDMCMHRHGTDRQYGVFLQLLYFWAGLGGRWAFKQQPPSLFSTYGLSRRADNSACHPAHAHLPTNHTLGILCIHSTLPTKHAAWLMKPASYSHAAEQAFPRLSLYLSLLSPLYAHAARILLPALSSHGSLGGQEEAGAQCAIFSLPSLSFYGMAVHPRIALARRQKPAGTSLGKSILYSYTCLPMPF